jgi:quercetin dioxygenase-like cupin family protein
LALALAATGRAEDAKVVANGQYPLPPPPGELLTAVIVTYPPGAKSRAHRHDASAFVSVLSGSVRSQVEGGPARIFRQGESWFEPAGAHHLISENASKTSLASIPVVVVGAKDAKLTIVDPP